MAHKVMMEGGAAATTTTRRRADIDSAALFLWWFGALVVVAGTLGILQIFWALQFDSLDFRLGVFAGFFERLWVVIVGLGPMTAGAYLLGRRGLVKVQSFALLGLAALCVAFLAIFLRDFLTLYRANWAAVDAGTRAVLLKASIVGALYSISLGLLGVFVWIRRPRS